MLRLQRGRIFGLGFCAIIAAPPVRAFAEERPSTQPSDDVLLLDSLGRIVVVPREDVPRSLQPRATLGLENQIPNPVKGAATPKEVLHRTESSRAEQQEFRLFPRAQPRLMPYLASMDEFGNTAANPGALVPVFPLESLVQGVKFELSEIGIRYSLQQTFTYVTLSDVMQGADNFALYTFDLQGKWAIFDAPAAGSAAWLSYHIEAQSGLGTAADDQSAASNLGSISDPTGILSSKEGFRISELAWQQSFSDGQIVIVAGVVNQGDYFDANAYANSGRGQFINSALINSMVLPLPSYNFGFNVQWQPQDEWYAMFGGSIGNAGPGDAPWEDFESDFWSVQCEVGYAPKDFCGLGPGIYRVQPFVARAGGPVQGGLGFNVQQQLGADSPFGVFARVGFGGSDVSAGAKAQVGAGLVVHAPFSEAGLKRKRDNDLLGIGFVWSQPSESSSTIFHENEYVLETFYALQLSPTVKLQPDVQIVWDPAFNPDGGPSAVFQLQMVLVW